MALCAVALLLAFRLRFLDEPRGIPDRYWTLYLQSVAFVAVGKVIVFAAFGLYQKWWRYVGLRDFAGIVRAVAVSSLILIVVFTVAKPFDNSLPRSVAVMDFMFTLGLVAGARLLVRLVVERPGRGARLVRGRDVLVVGAGSGGQMVVRELQLNPHLGSVAIGFVDDDARKRGMRMLGLKVLGTTSEIGRILDEAEPDEVVIAIPSAVSRCIRATGACSSERPNLQRVFWRTARLTSAARRHGSSPYWPWLPEIPGRPTHRCVPSVTSSAPRSCQSFRST